MVTSAVVAVVAVGVVDVVEVEVVVVALVEGVVVVVVVLVQEAKTSDITMRQVRSTQMIPFFIELLFCYRYSRAYSRFFKFQGLICKSRFK